MLEQNEIFEPYQENVTLGEEALAELTGGKGDDDDGE